MLFVGWQDQEWYIGDLSNSFCVALYQDEVAWFAEIEKKTFLTYYMLHDLFGEKTRRQVFSKQVSCYHLGGRKLSEGEYI